LKSPSSALSSGLLGVLFFAGSLPATRAAVLELSPLFLTSARAAIAALFAITALTALRAKRPKAADLPRLGAVVAGAVFGFPLLSAMALRDVTAVHSIVFAAFLPVSTAIFSVVLGEPRPHPAFWAFAAMGTGVVLHYATSGGFAASGRADLLLFIAVSLAGLGYAAGAQLARRIGGWQVISWALVGSLPVTASLALWNLPPNVGDVSLAAWAGLAYVSVFSMFVAFLFWYRGLALGGIAAVSQLQLLQPFLSLLIAAAVLAEPIDSAVWRVLAMLLLCVAGARRSTLSPAPTRAHAAPAARAESPSAPPQAPRGRVLNG